MTARAVVALPFLVNILWPVAIHAHLPIAKAGNHRAAAVAALPESSPLKSFAQGGPIAAMAPRFQRAPDGRSIQVPMLARPGVAPAATGAPVSPRGLILKLRPTVKACLSCKVQRGKTLGGLGVASQLDDLNRRFGLRAARPLIGGRLGGASKQRSPTARAEQLSAKFPRRALRAPTGAHPPDLGRVYLLEVGHRGNLEEVARAYAADPAVEYCEPDGTMQVALVPNDPYFATQGSWGQGFDDLWGVKQIAAPAAWDTTRGAGVLVAVVDTGIDYTHPDIAANVWTNPGEIPGNGIDDDGNGFVDDEHGWNFANGNHTPLDDHFHGTHVAGTIAAVGNNATGVIGVAFESRVMAVRALNKYGFGFWSDLARAIIYAVDNGADVINASWGGGHSDLIADALAYAHAAGVVFVAAAGNANSDTMGFSPADDPNAITVAASTHLDTKASFSNYGVKLDVTAPGGGDGPPPPDDRRPVYSVLSLRSAQAQFDRSAQTLLVGSQYLRLAGTSMATPHVAATVALILSAHPDFSVEQVRQVLRTTADDLDPPGPDRDSGYGRVNAARAVAAPPPLVAHLSSPAAAMRAGETTIPIQGSASGPGFASYTIEYAPAAALDTWTPVVGPITTPVDDDPLGTWNVGELMDGTYVLRLRVERTDGETFVDRTPVILRSITIDAPARLSALRPDAPIEIRGTAAGAGFVSYKVEYRRPAQEPALWETGGHDIWRTDGLTLAAPPGTPVRHGLLATLDASALTEGERFDFRLTVVNANGTLIWRRRGIVIDPTLRAGWPQQLSDAADADYLTVADLDGDGIKEILVGSDTEVVVFEPDGSIRPGWPQSVVTTDPFVWTNGSPIVADVTGDAAPEVIASNGDDLFVWSADGTLMPGFPRQVDAWTNSGNFWLTAADLDGDGKDEIICQGTGRSQALFGDGRVVSGWNGDGPKGTSDMPIAVGDVFGDGRAEAAFYNRYYGQFEFWWLPNWGVYALARCRSCPPARTLALRGPDRGLFPGWIQRESASYFTHVGMADFNGDGQLDLTTLRETSLKAYPWVGPASGSARNARGGRISLRSDALRCPKGIRCMKPDSNGLFSYADLDRDGRAEAYVYSHSYVDAEDRNDFGQFISFRALGGPRPAPVRMHNPFYTVRWQGAVAVGDVDGDGQQELVAGAYGFDNHWVARALVVAHPDGTLLAPFPKPIPQVILDEPGDTGRITIHTYYDDPRYTTPAIADLDGDGLKEILWVDIETGRLYVWNVAGTPAPELADWPMYHHDPKHTNTLPPRR